MSDFYFPAPSIRFGKYDSYGAPELLSTVVLRISLETAHSPFISSSIYTYMHS